MQITALKKQIKNPERVSIFVDGKYSFSLSLSELVTEKIKNGMELDTAQLKRLQKISADGKIQARALAWLLNRPHSTREFTDYLKRKKADPELIENLLEIFITKKYLNDTAYAKWLAELRGRAGKSDRAIRSELFSKGINREVIDDTLSSSNDEQQRLTVLIAKKQKIARYKDDELKLKQYLAGQGFSYQQIKETLHQQDT